MSTTPIERPNLTRDQLADLHVRYLKSRSPKDQDTLFRAHYGFAVKIAMRYVVDSYTADEAISSSCLGLLEALKRYNPKKGAFATIAFWWIFKHLMRDRAAAQHIVKIPIGLVRQARQVRKLRLLGRDDLHIAEEVGVNTEELHLIENIYHRGAPQTFDIPQPRFIPEEDSQPSPRDACIEQEDEEIRDGVRYKMKIAVGAMDLREQDIIWGRHSTPPTPFSALGIKYGISRERVRKIYNTQMTKLKKQCGGQHGASLD